MTCPLLVWGEYDQDALRVRGVELGIALDALHAIGGEVPCSFRLWSVNDDQLFGVMNGNECALYVVASPGGYGTSVGDPMRGESYELADHDVGALALPWSDCVPWAAARAALVEFAECGELPGVVLDGRIPPQLLMLGDVDRTAELESRRSPPTDLGTSSLPRLSPCSDWAKRLLSSLVELQLIELDTDIRDAITTRVTVLLMHHGSDAMDSLEVAQLLAKELGRLRGIGALFATAGDLQIALRRTQDPPTAPVVMAFL